MSSEFQKLYKSTGGRMTKPGDGTHTPRWDRCVAHVKENSPGADPYAVCTAMLGDETLKAMDEGKFNAVLDKALGTIGIAAGGPIPRSLLARQDLEGESAVTKGFTSHAALVERIRGNQRAKVAKGSSFRDAWAAVKPR